MLAKDQILFSDNHLLAVSKPGGLLTQPSGTEQDSIEAQAKEWIKAEFKKPGAVFLEAVHRIDREVSGVVLFARTSKALSRMNEQMREKKVRKIYHALIEQPLPKNSGTLTHWLIHGDHRALVGCETDQDAKEAILHYRVLGTARKLWLVEIQLETGRYHQIRAQLAAEGCPIAGDSKYGASRDFAENSIALHHRQLEVIHPVQKTPLTLIAPYPPAWPL
ncbi:MAG: RluA family pseudouridine synthase [Kiritimatiellia bacterium]